MDPVQEPLREPLAGQEEISPIRTLRLPLPFDGLGWVVLEFKG